MGKTVNSIFSSMFSETRWLRQLGFFEIAGSAVPKSLTVNLEEMLKSPAALTGIVGILYGVRGVSQIKFTMCDSFLVLYDFDILSMIKRKNPFGFYCVILILNLSRLISPITILICKVCRV